MKTLEDLILEEIGAPCQENISKVTEYILSKFEGQKLKPIRVGCDGNSYGEYISIDKNHINIVQDGSHYSFYNMKGASTSKGNYLRFHYVICPDLFKENSIEYFEDKIAKSKKKVEEYTTDIEKTHKAIMNIEENIEEYTNIINLMKEKDKLELSIDDYRAYKSLVEK